MISMKEHCIYKLNKKQQSEQQRWPWSTLFWVNQTYHDSRNEDLIRRTFQLQFISTLKRG